MSRPTEAERLRTHRLMFERAMRDGVSMAEARRRAAQERWAEAERRMEARKGLCGTAAPAFAASSVPIDDSDDGLAWFQR